MGFRGLGYGALGFLLVGGSGLGPVECLCTAHWGQALGFLGLGLLEVGAYEKKGLVYGIFTKPLNPETQTPNPKPQSPNGATHLNRGSGLLRLRFSLKQRKQVILISSVR